MKQIGLVVGGTALATMLALGLQDLAHSHDPGGKHQGEKVLMKSSKDLDWRDAEALPKGAKTAVLEGDPSVEGEMYNMRIKVPAGYRIPPHRHPTVERVTVLEGTVSLGMGEKFEEDEMRDLTAGGYFAIPTGHAHFFRARTDAIIQLHGPGAWGITYVNPEDDPRKRPRAGL